MRSKLLKNLQIKKKLKRLGALGLCALLIAGNLTIPDVAKAASPNATYKVPGEKVIENVLTYFQYFTSGDCTITKHTVGSIAVGGNLTSTATFGDGAKTASYAKHVVSAVAPQIKDDYKGVCNDMYYGTAAEGLSLAGFTQNASYMDIDSMFEKIKNESTALAGGGTAPEIVVNDNGTVENKQDDTITLVLDFKGAVDSYTINYAELKVYCETNGYNIDNINYIEIRVNSVQDFISKKCVVNIVGLDNSQPFTIFSGGGAGESTLVNGPNNIAVKLMDGSEISNKQNGFFNFLYEMGGDENGNGNGQYFHKGMKLLFNLPDYTGTLNTVWFAGHVVAPNATVSSQGGTLEGGIIAKNIQPALVSVGSGIETTVQAHYYPYGVPTDHYSCSTLENGEPTVDDIILTKEYVLSADPDASSVSEAQLPPVGYGAKFTLYSVINNNQPGTPIDGAENIEAVLYDGQHYRVVVPGTNSALQVGGKYILKETTPAHGFEPSNTEYLFEIDEHGDVKYSINGSGHSYETPVCRNVKSMEEGTLVVTVKEANSSNNISDVNVTIKVGDNEAVYRTGKTDGSGTVTFNNMPEAENYKVIIDDKIPECKEYENVASDQKVQTGNTTNVIFELEKETVQQPETGTITITVRDTVTDELFKNFGPVTISVNGIAESSIDTDPETGKAIFDNLSPGTYTVEIPEITTGYKQLGEDERKETIVITESELNKSYEFELEPAGKLQVTVKGDGEPISGALITITNKDDPNCVYSEKPTNANGQVELDELTPGRYVIYLEPVEGFKEPANNEVEVYVSQNGATYEFLLAAEEPTVGKIIVNVKKDSSNGNGMDDVSVTVTSTDNSADTFTKKTENGGTVTFADLPQGDYNVTIEGQTGYTIASDNPQLANVIAGQDTTKEFILQQNGTITINVTCDGTGVEGVEVEVTPYPGSGDSRPYITDSNGQIKITDVSPKDYEVLVKNKNGYTITGDNPKTSTVTAGGESTYNFTLVKTATLTIKVIDTQTGNLVNKKSYVNISKDNNGTLQYFDEKTVPESNVVKVNVTKGTYSVSLIPPTNYNWVDSGYEMIDVNPDLSSQYEMIFYVAQIKKIEVTVTKDGQPVVNPDLTIRVKGQDGTYKDHTFGPRTDNDGIVLFDRIPQGDYEVVLKVPGENGGTVTYSKTGTLEENETIDTVMFDLSTSSTPDTGTILISVKDDNPNGGEFVPGVNVTVKDSDDNTIYTGTTTREAAIEIPDLEEGKYTVTVGNVENHVLVGDNDVEQEVNKDGITYYDFVLSKRCTLKVEVLDKTTGLPIASPMISVTNKSDVNKETSDVSEYTLSGLEAGTYEATVEAPGGYVLDGDAMQSVTLNPYDVNTHNEPHTLIFYVKETATNTGTITVDVKETDENGNAISNVPVTLQKKDTNDVYTDYVTGQKTTETGTVKFENLPEGDYKVVIPETNSGYKTLAPNECVEELSITSNDTTGEAAFYLTPVGKLEIHVKDDNPAGSSYVDGVTVTVEDKDGNTVSIGGQTTAGVITLDDLTPGEYIVKIGGKNGYIVKNNEKEIKQTVNAGETATVYNFTLAKTGKINVIIKDAITNEEVSMGVAIKGPKFRPDGSDYNTTLELLDDEKTIDYVTAGEHTYSLQNISPQEPGYGMASGKERNQTVNFNPYVDAEAEITFYVQKYATLEIDIYDITTGTPIHLDGDGDVIAKIEILRDSQSFDTKSLTYGNSEYAGVLNGQYQTTLTDLPAGYQVVSEGGNSVVTDIDPYDPNGPAGGIYSVQFNVTRTTLTITVVDRDDNNNGVSGVEVLVPNAQGGTETKITDEDGEIVIEGLPFGDYSTKITVPGGYKLVDPTTTEQGATLSANNNSAELTYALCQVGSLKVTVVEEGTTTPVMGVNVTVTNKDDNTITYNLTTNDMNNGVLTFNGLQPGTYIVESTASVTGYKTLTDAESKCEITVPGKEQKTHTFEYEPKTADLIITVTDEKTNAPVPGAKVKISKPEGAGEPEVKETGNDGRIVMKGLRKGKYTTTVVSVPEGYNVTTDEEVVVDIDPANAPEAQVDYKVAQVGALKVTITEKGTTNGIYGVQVAITTNAGGTEKTVYTYTDANGQVNLTGQEVGTYKISIPTSIAGYKELDAAYVVQTKDVEANKTTEYAFEVEKVTTADPNKGDAEIIVKDEVTGNPVPGASVIVTAPDNTKRKYTTDGNGVISMPQQEPGEYKIEVLEVPAGYTVTQNQQTTITVVAGSMVKTEIKVKPADSTGNPSEGVSGSAGEAQPDNGGTTGNNGGTVNTGGTSNSTGDVVNTGGATDSNTGGVITTGQTDGATNNKTADSQSVSKQPKTGDESNPGIIWIILSVSACLAAASAIGLIYVKKKED